MTTVTIKDSRQQWAKSSFQNEDELLVDFRKRQPKEKNIWYFRISKKYRAFAELQDDRLIVFHISHHQD